MADLNPLKFAVAIQDLATKQLQEIENKLNSLKDHTIKLHVEGKEEIQSALNIDNLVQQIRNAKQALQGNSFDTFEKHMNAAAESVDKLTKNLNAFETAIKNDSGLKAYLTGLGSTIQNLRASMAQLHGGEITSRAVNNNFNQTTLSRSMKVAEHEFDRIQNILLRAERTIETFGDKGFNTARIERYKTALLEVRNTLEYIQKSSRDGGGGGLSVTGLTASQYLNSEDVSRAVSLLTSELSLYKNIGDELERITKLRNELSSMLAANPTSAYAGALSSAIAGLDLRQGLLSRLGTRDALDSLNTEAYRSQISEAVGLISKVNAETRQSAKESKTAQTENEKWAASMNTAAIAVTNLKLKLTELEAIRDRGVSAGVNVTALEQKIAEIRNMLSIMQSIEAGMKIHGFAGDYIKSSPYQNTLKLADVEAGVVNKNAQEKENAARATEKLNVQEQMLAQSLKSTTSAMRGQSQLLSDLKSLATQYLGVWGAQGFLNNIIKIGGQLESQRLSLTAILGQRSYANDLFEDVQKLALKSPFGVVQLDQYTKNLSAFGFQYNELFDMTKRLADIAAGTGTDFGRLALALGHVRSEMALTGYTLRQFSMANVPMLKKLSENLGVTTAEIRKMVREKKVSYEDVEKVLKDLTDEGGMFYNMQEVMSGAVSAKFKNLKDAMSIMYGQMAESTLGDMLKGIASTLTDVTKRWETFGTVLLTTAALIGTYKLYMHMLNLGIKTNTINILQNTVATKTLTAADVEQMVEKKLLTAQDVALALAEGRLTMEQAKGALVTAGYTEAIVGQIAATRGLSGAMAGVKASTAGMMGILTNPWTAALVAVEAVIGAVMAYRTWSEGIDADVERGFERAKTASQEIGKYLKESEKEGKPDNERDLSTQIEQMKTILMNSELYTEELQEQVGLAPSLSAEYDVLIKKMKDANDNLAKMGINSDAIASSLKASSSDISGWDWFKTIGFFGFSDIGNSNGKVWDFFFNDDINKNSEQLEKSLGLYQRIIASLDEYRSAMESAMQSAIEFSGRSDLANLPLEEQVRLLSQDEEAWDYFVRTVDGGSGKFVEVAKKLKDAAEDVNDDWNEIVSDDVPRMMDKLASEFGKTPDEFRAWAKKHNIIFQGMLDTMVSAVNIASPKIATALKNAVLGWLDGFSDVNLEDRVLTEAEKAEKKRRDEQIKRNNTIKGYGQIGQNAMRTLVNYAKSHGKGDKNGNGIFDINFVGDYFKSEGTTNEGLEAIAKDYKKYKGLINAAKKAGNKSEEELYKRRFEQLDVAMDAFGLDKTKGDKKNKSGDKDEDAKRLREKVRILKEAADSYKYWRDKVGDEGAETHVESEFGKLLSEQGFKFDNIEKFRETLAELRKEYEKKPQSKAMLEALKELDREVAKLDRNDFEKNTEDYLSKMKSELDSLSRAWEIYKDVRDTTGDEKLAELLSGVSGLSNFRTLADAVQKKMIDDFSALGVKKGLTFDVNLSDKQIEKEVFAAVPRETDESVEKYEERIKGLIELYKKWRDLQLATIKADAASFSGLIGLTQSYDAQIKKINDKLKQQKDSNNAMIGKTDGSGKTVTQAMADHANDIAQTQADWEKMQLSARYANLYNNAIAMSRKEFDAATTAVEKMIDRLKELGLLTPDQAIQEQQKLEKARIEYSTTGFLGEKGAVGQFISGGYDGLLNYYAKRRDAAQQKANKAKKGSKEQEDAQAEADKYGKLFDKLSKLSDTVNDVITAFNVLQSGLDLVTNLFDSMGANGAATAAGDAAGLLGGALSGASSLSALGPWGMAAGAALGLASGIFQLHDKSLQRQIEAIQEEVDALEANTQAIKTYRERTFGYDDGELRRSMSKLYKETSRTKEINIFGKSYQFKYDSAALNAMREYYQMNSSGSGYAQELANLKQQREDYIKMYDLENDKKKKSQDALDEYRNKIAELDEQIRYFAEDLAKDLWSIDLKEWADQIGDSLMTAFENGENAAEAFKDTVQDIMRQVLRKMLSLGIIQPMMENLQKKLFGENGKAGIFDANNPEGTIDAAMREVSAFFGEGGEGQKMIEATQTFYNKWQALMRSNGLTLEDNGSSSSSGSSIKSITEHTADLIASYINAVRADVSVIRALTTQYFVMYYTAITSGNESLKNIENHTAAIMRSNEEIARLMKSLDDRFRGLENKTWKLPVA